MDSESKIVEEVRARAAALSARYGDDLKKYASHIKAIEAEKGVVVGVRPSAAGPGAKDGTGRAA